MTLLELSAKIAKYWHCKPAQAGAHAYRVLQEYPQTYREAAYAILAGSRLTDSTLHVRKFSLSDVCGLTGCDALMGIELLWIYEKDETLAKELMFSCGAHDRRE